MFIGSDFMKFYIYTLGCKVNAYETNVMRDKLINNGYIKRVGANKKGKWLVIG